MDMSTANKTATISIFLLIIVFGLWSAANWVDDDAKELRYPHKEIPRTLAMKLFIQGFLVLLLGAPTVFAYGVKIENEESK